MPQPVKNPARGQTKQLTLILSNQLWKKIQGQRVAKGKATGVTPSVSDLIRQLIVDM